MWPKKFETGMELDTPEYWGKVKGDLIVEKQLAMGGSKYPSRTSLLTLLVAPVTHPCLVLSLTCRTVRLAAILNSIFDPALEGRMEIARS